MRVVIDIEANGLVNPDKVWLIVCKDIDTGIMHVFRGVSDDPQQAERFRYFASSVRLWVGHNWLGYDYPVLVDLGLLDGNRNIVSHSIDTLIISKLVDYSRPGHSIEDYGKEFGLAKGDHSDFSKFSIELEQYCIRDVEITHKVYLKYLRYILDKNHKDSIELEHKFQLLVNSLSTNGFSFNIDKAKVLLTTITEELKVLDFSILKEFPPKEVTVREFTPRATKFGTINRTSVPRSLHKDLHLYEIGKTYKQTKLVEFNPSSHKQLVDVLSEAGWRPVDKTATHINHEREYKRLERQRKRSSELDVRLQELYTALSKLEKYGWKINENNLATLPSSAPSPARNLAKRILLESRRRTLVEWLGLVQPDGRIHGKFYGIGAWTHRMAHQQPNTANIPGEFKLDGTKKLFGKEFRQLWRAPKKRLLVGVDAEGIQLRIFAHYIDDAEFTRSLVEGKKENKSDPHSLNQMVLGPVCKSRAAAKRYIYALLLGAGKGKLKEILECSEDEAVDAYERLLSRYTGFATLKETVIPADGKRGWFVGLDGRKVRIPGETQGDRAHLCMSGYLQNGEAVVMKKAAVLWNEQLTEEEIEYLFVNMVHDEWQTECANNVELARYIAQKQADSLRIVGEELGLKCPLAGSYWNDDHKDYTIGTNWYATH